MDLKLDSTTWDIVVENGDLALITGRDAIIQNVSQRLQTFYAEFFLNRSIGIPYLQLVFIKGFQLELISSIFKAEIIKTPGIVKLTEFNLTVDSINRTFSLTFSAESTEGVIDFNEELEIAA